MTEKKTEAPTGLWAKLLLAQSLAGAVEQRGKNKDQHYSYAKAEDVIKEAQRALHEAGLVGYMVPGGHTEREIEARSGAGGLWVTLTSTLTIVDPDDPAEKFEVAVTGTGTDYPGDKAIYKAMTGATKYAYASALGIPFGDDPEDGGEAPSADSGRKPRASSDGQASAAQKRLATSIFNEAGVSRDMQKAIVTAIAGSPPSVKGMSEILDLIVEVRGNKEALRVAIARLTEQAGVKVAGEAPADPIPGDETGLEDAAKEASAAAEKADAEPSDEPDVDEEYAKEAAEKTKEKKA